MVKYNAILMFGPPGVGKGTQAKLLGDDPKYLHFSTGDMFRGLKDNPEMANSEIGIKVRELIDHGLFAPDNITVELFTKTLEQYQKDGKYDPSKQILLLDGIPRNPDQVDMIDEYINVKKIIYLVSTNDDVLVKRITKRGELEGRADDQNETIVRGRLDTYKQQTQAVLDKYDTTLLEEVNGMGTIEEVDTEVRKRIANWK